MIAALRTKITLEAEEGGFRRGLTKKGKEWIQRTGSTYGYFTVMSETACMMASRFLIDARAR